MPVPPPDIVREEAPLGNTSKTVCAFLAVRRFERASQPPVVVSLLVLVPDIDLPGAPGFERS